MVCVYNNRMHESMPKGFRRIQHLEVNIDVQRLKGTIQYINFTRNAHIQQFKTDSVSRAFYIMNIFKGKTKYVVYV